MFEFLFKYPASVFSKGTFVLLGKWPPWVLAILVIVGACLLAWSIWRRKAGFTPAMQGTRSVLVWLLQTTLVALLLLLLWQPALSVATLRPQQNVVAVVLDDSKSMAVADVDSRSRHEALLKTLNSGLLNNLKEKFQVRLYRLGDTVERLEKPDTLNASAPATHIGSGLKEVVADSATLPIGAVVLMSDGADNSGGIDLETLNEIKRQRIPIHTIGFGSERFAHDIELTDVVLPARSLAQSRLKADVSFRQNGFSGERVKLVVRDGGKITGSRDITFKQDGATQTEALLFNAGAAGVKNLEFSIDVQPAEQNRDNNRQVRALNVSNSTPSVLYMEGEPRWDYKFLRRAVEDDKNIKVVSIVRTTQNKIYRQGIEQPTDLEQGFPTKVEELFNYQAIILGSVEANYFSLNQKELIQQFVDRRGGGLLFMGGRASLADGGYDQAPFADLLPVALPNRRNTFQRDPANAELTSAGKDSLITRIEEDPTKNVDRWKHLPYLMNYQEVGNAKPGALVLAEMTAAGHRMPLLITENFGRGRTAVFATGGDWRWQMLQPVSDMSHEIFWRQLLRWLVSDTPTRVVASTSKAVVQDEGKVKLRAEVRDMTYLPTSDATVEAHVSGPGGTQTVELHPDPLKQGSYEADWEAERPGSYVVDIAAQRGKDELGRGVTIVRREDGVAENFHLEQNRELLEKLAAQTGGKYYAPEDAKKLGQDISYSEAGITVRENKDLWDMPIVFFVALLLRSSEWLLRRKWGVV
jgi:uncharacterized membrane protein